jgi:threonine dehydrogenase-like Zn-dependent dehydrogenase
VLECVGYEESTITALSVARPGGAVGRVGVPQDATVPRASETFFKNIPIGGGPAPVRAYIAELLPDGRGASNLDACLTAPRVSRRPRWLSRDEREAIKVMIMF